MTDKTAALTEVAAAAAARVLTAPEFQHHAQVPAAAEWFSNIDNPNTRRAYRSDLQEFMRFVGIQTPEELRLVTRAHVLAWRADLERQNLARSTIRRKLAALSSLFEYLCEENVVRSNPVDGVKRPKVESYEGKTPALGDAQARHLLRQPAGEDLQSVRDRALLSVMLYHGLRREEVESLEVPDIHLRAASRLCACTGKATSYVTFPYTQVSSPVDRLSGGLGPRSGSPLPPHSE